MEDPGQLRYLQLCPRLATLTLEGNPLCLRPGSGSTHQVRTAGREAICVPAPWPAGEPLCPPERARSQQIPGDPPRACQGLLTGAPSHIAGGLAAAPTPPWAMHNWTPKGHTYLGQALAHVCSWESSMHAPCRAQSPRGVGYAHPVACRPRSEVPLCWGPHHLGQSSLHPPGCFCPPRG